MSRRKRRSRPERLTEITAAAVRQYVDLIVHPYSYTSTAMARDLVTLAARYESDRDERLAEVIRQGLAMFVPGFVPDPLQALQLANFRPQDRPVRRR